MLCQLQLANGPLPHLISRMVGLRFRTSPDWPGTEKLVVASIKGAEKDQAQIATSDVAPQHPHLMTPMSTFHVKGWTRSVCATCILLHAYEDNDCLQARSQERTLVERTTASNLLVVVFASGLARGCEEAGAGFTVRWSTTAVRAMCAARSFRTIWATCIVDEPRKLVESNRGITLSSTSTRRKPNAFHLLHQLTLQRGLGCLQSGTLEASRF